MRIFLSQLNFSTDYQVLKLEFQRVIWAIRPLWKFFLGSNVECFPGLSGLQARIFSIDLNEFNR